MIRFALLLGLTAILAGPGRLEAGFVIRAVDNSPVIAAAGASGSFDVVLENTGGSVIEISSFQFTLSVNGGVQFTDANYSTSTTYLFDGLSTNQILGDPLSFDSFPNTSFTASDAYFDVGGFTVNPGAAFGLGHVAFTAPNSFPTASVVLLSDVVIGDANGNAIDPSTYSLQSGQIEPQGSGGGGSVTPEPASLTLLGTGVLGLAGFAWRRRMLKRVTSN